MEQQLFQLGSRLFEGIRQEDIAPMLSCVGYHTGTFSKGDIISFEGDHLKHIGIILSGTVDMVKEDLWGNKTILLRQHPGELFGESFVCGDDALATVSFAVSEEARILFLPFSRVMRSCSMACEFHHRLTENMVYAIANKNRELLRKIEVLSKRTTREKLLAYLSIQAEMNHCRYFEIPLGRLELAEYLCVDRSAMTRELAKMKAEGILDYHQNCFRML